MPFGRTLCLTANFTGFRLVAGSAVPAMSVGFTLFAAFVTGSITFIVIAMYAIITARTEKDAQRNDQ